MAKTQVETRVNADLEKVFSAFADIPRAADHINGITRIEMVTDGDVGKGTRFRETRVMFKKEHTEEMEIVDFQPNKSYTVRCDSCGATYESEILFTPNGDSTTVRMNVNCTPVSFMAKLMSPISVIMMGPMKKMMQSDFDDMKAAVERQN